MLTANDVGVSEINDEKLYSDYMRFVRTSGLSIVSVARVFRSYKVTEEMYISRMKKLPERRREVLKVILQDMKSMGDLSPMELSERILREGYDLKWRQLTPEPQVLHPPAVSALDAFSV